MTDDMNGVDQLSGVAGIGYAIVHAVAPVESGPVDFPLADADEQRALIADLDIKPDSVVFNETGHPLYRYRADAIKVGRRMVEAKPERKLQVIELTF